MADKTLNDVFDEIIADAQHIATQAVKKAAKKAQNDIMKEADSYLQLYYNSYDPAMYDRTYQLKNAIEPIFKDRSSGGNTSITIGVRYNPSKLAGAYHSNSRYHKYGDGWKDVTKRDDTPNNGIPQPEWILNNFLQGQHGGYQRDFNATYNLMQEFFENELQDKLNTYIYNEMFNAIVSRL